MPFFFGSPVADVQNGSSGFDLFLSLAGTDTIRTGDGFDLAFAGADNDSIIAGSGFKILSGGQGNDTFGAEDNASGTAVITDFQGGDQIDVSNFGITSFDQLTLEDNGRGGTLITVGDFTFNVRDLNPEWFIEGDFIYADVETDTINFDDLVGDSFTPMPTPYEGFDWDGFYFVEASDLASAGTQSGYIPTSGDVVALNGFEATVTLSRDTAFDFEAANLGAAWNDGLQVTFEGFLNGQSTGAETFTVDATGLVAVEFNDAIFDVVDAVVISSTGGTPHGYPSGSGTHFVMDDLEVGFLDIA